MMTFARITIQAALAVITLAIMAINTLAVAPTEEAIKKWKAEGVWEQKVANWKAFKKAGGDAPEAHSVFNKEKRHQNLALGIQTVDTVNVIVILVDFSDWPYTGQSVAGTTADFDSTLFSNRDTDTIFNNNGSMTDYYLENSYGQFYIKGDIYGWYRMDSTYEWYVGDDDGMTRGRYLAADAVDAAAADTSVHFSDYDHDHDGYCDGVIIIHAGRGAEEQGVYGIWSHKWEISPPKTYDSVLISAYTMNPEEFGFSLSPIGVFCHEYGHILGLPDLYDIEYHTGSDGLGKWTIMASGNYLFDGKKPAHFDAWCKATIGFLDFIEVDANVFQAPISAVEYNPVAYKLQNGSSGNEYWVVENRQNVGFDLHLPSPGLCIYHVDTLAPINNTNPDRYYVAMEQADGHNDLAFTPGNNGDPGDPWPGAAHAREFHNLSNPNSKTNVGDVVTEIGVWRISDSDSIMFADFDVEYSRPWVELYGSDPLRFFDDLPGGDGNGILEPGETIKFYCTIINKMRGSYNVHATLAVSNPAVTFITNDVSFGVNLFETEVSNIYTPIEFTLADTLTSSIDSFFLTITTDSLSTTPGSGEFTKTFGFEVYLGEPQVLIVDDDRGDSYEQRFEEVFSRMRIPFDIWHKHDSGSPAGTDLAPYSKVFWHTGAPDSSSVLNVNDIAAMKEFLDEGGNLLLTTASGVSDMNALDSAFLPDYFHAAYVDTHTNWWFIFDGVTNNPIGNGTKYFYDYNDPWGTQYLIEPINGGQAAFIQIDKPDTIYGVTYTGKYKSILLTFPVEFIDDEYAVHNPGFYPKDTLIARAMQFFGGNGTSVYDGQPFGQLPRNFELCQNYPNPFNPVTNISYTLRATGDLNRSSARTNLSIYNILGQKVRTLVDKVQVPGTYVVPWNGTDSFGRPVASGIYLYRLVRGNDSEVKKMVLVK